MNASNRAKAGVGESPFRAFQRQPSMIDFPGRLAAVFFVGGCNFRCRYCHNSELIPTDRPGLPWLRLDEVCREFARNWVSAAVITGGEPTQRSELPECIAFFRERGWAVKLDTNGSNPDMLEQCLPLVDYVAMDVKADLPGYRELTGFDDGARMLRSIGLIKRGARDYCFRTTVVEPFHSDARMRAIGDLIGGARRYVLQPFVPRETVADPIWAALPRTSDRRLAELRLLLEDCADRIE